MADLHLSPTDSTLTDVRRIQRKDAKPGPLILSCKNMAQRTAIFRASRQVSLDQPKLHKTAAG